MTISDIPEETLREYIATSKTYKEILQKCGYNNCGCSTYLKKRIHTKVKIRKHTLKGDTLKNMGIAWIVI